MYKESNIKAKKVIATCPAGLGNRIKCLVSTIKKCDYLLDKGTDAVAHVYWPINDACGCEFEDLFRLAIPLVKVHRGELSGAEVEAYTGGAEINKSWKFVGNEGPIDFQYHKLKQSQINEFLPYFGFIQPSKDIEDTAWAFINKYKESFDKGEVIGVHLRKGDYKVSFDGRQNISKEEDFIERMNCLLEVNPNYKFLLCTEDKETEEKFQEIFDLEGTSNNANAESTILIFPKRYRNRNEANSIKEAFVDMLLLSRCPIILGTFLSTFTEIAWWFSGCKSQVYIPGVGDREAVAKVWAKLPKEGEGIHKKLIRRIKIWWKEGI